MGRGGARALVGVGLAALMAMILPSCAPVTAFTVDDTTDLVDASPGDGLCASSAGTCTLRAAIQEGNATAGGGASITLQSGATYALSIAGAGDDAAATGDLDVVGPITLHGNGATVDARGLDRVVQVLPTGALTADHLTITGGTAPYGGGVRIDLGGHATITSATISANQATGLTECDIQGGTITSCTTETTGAAEFPPQEGGGAGLWNRGTLGLSQSTVSGNTAAPNACFLRGLRTLDGWCDYSLGGGLLNTGTALVLTSTISGNTAGGGAAAATWSYGWESSIEGGPSQLTLAAVTTTGNQSSGFPIMPGDVTHGAGSFGSFALNTLWVSGSALDGFCDGVAINPGGSSVTKGHNVFVSSTCDGSGSGGGPPAQDPTDLKVASLGLGPLADNGGPTRTHLPLTGSPLLDAVPIGTASLCDGTLATDQRGVARPQGPACDVGAVER